MLAGLPGGVSFGYQDPRNDKMKLKDSGRFASKANPEGDYAHGVVIGERHAVPGAEFVFEVAVAKHGGSWSGSFKIGLIAVPKGRLRQFTVPRYSPKFSRSWMWSDTYLYEFADSDVERSRSVEKL